MEETPPWLDAAEASIDDSASPEITVNEGLEPGCHVHLREDVCVPRRVYVFEAYDSDAPADANSMVVDVLTGDWTMRGFAEPVPVLAKDGATSRAGG